MKALLLFSLTLFITACSSTKTTIPTTTGNIENTSQALTLEQIAEKSQSTKNILEEENLYVPAYLNNTSRNSTKDLSNTQLSVKENKKNTVTK